MVERSIFPVRFYICLQFSHLKTIKQNPSLKLYIYSSALAQFMTFFARRGILLGSWTQFHCVEGCSHPPTSNSPRPTGSYNSTQFWPYLPGGDVRSHRLRIQDCSPSTPLQTPITSPGCYRDIWLTVYKSEIAMTHSLASINLLQQLTELKKLFTH